MVDTSRDRALALLKSIASECDGLDSNDDHAWRKCRHCLAIEELGHRGVRENLRAFLASAETAEAERDALRAKYYDLLYQVGNVHQGESRHDTAKRYLIQSERNYGGPAQAIDQARANPGASKESK